MSNKWNMYSAQGKSSVQRITQLAIHLTEVMIALWLLFGGGIETVARWVGAEWTPGDAGRRIALAACALIYFLRVLFTVTVLIRRAISWGEVISVTSWLCIIHVTFTLLGGTQAATLGVLDVIGIGIFALGSYLNTASEWQRHVWKQDPENKGKLYTGGLFRFATHVNYTGDVLLFTGFAIVTHSLWSGIIPALILTNYIFIFMPQQDKYLAEKYGKPFEEFSSSRAKIIPFIH